MEENAFSAPQAELIDDSNNEISGVNQEFYVVSTTKFLVLYITSLGIYSLYWFYKHWQQYKISNNEEMWPVMRAIFSIFFTHSLFEFINGKLQKSNSEYSWSPSTLASIYVVVSIVSHVTSNLSSEFIGSPLTDIISIASFPILGWCLYKAQVAANIACNDPNGESNYKYTIANYIWIALGVIFWGLVILGIVMVDSY